MLVVNGFLCVFHLNRSFSRGLVSSVVDAFSVAWYLYPLIMAAGMPSFD
jgi:hypothetical protein